MKRCSWFGPDSRFDGGVVRLFCFPHAGAGASSYRRLISRIPRWVDVASIQLPGREERLDELPYDDMESLVDAISEELAHHIRGRCLFLGCSFGALLAFETARTLQRRARPLDRLIVCASPGPTIFDAPAVEEPAVASDDLLLHRLKELGATPPRLLESPELMAVLLPAIRADFRMLDRYRFETVPKLRCPISAFGGETDTSVSMKDIEKWRFCSSSQCTCVPVPGDHFFVQRSPQIFESHLVALLTSAAGRQADRWQLAD